MQLHLGWLCPSAWGSNPAPAGSPPLPSFPAHCSPAAPLFPSWHPTVRGWVQVWEPGLGASLAAAGIPAEPAGSSTPGHVAIFPALQVSPSGDALCSSPPCLGPLPCPWGQARQGERRLSCHHPALRHAAGLVPCMPGTRPCAVTPRGWTLSKCLHVQDMNQPGQEHSSHSWTTQAAWQAALAAGLYQCQTLAGRQAACRQQCLPGSAATSQISPGHGKTPAWHVFPSPLHSPAPVVLSYNTAAPSQGNA